MVTVRAFIAIFIMAIVLTAEMVEGSEELMIDSEILANLDFDAPESLTDRKYLKLKDSPSFRLLQIRAKFVIIEIFSMYCPICQRDATVVNQLYDLVQKIPAFNENIRLIGIGAGNTPYEVSVFKKKFNVLFPLVADDNFIVQKALAQPIRTPTFLVGKLNGDGTLKIIFTKVGAIKDPEKFLKALVMASNSPKG